MNKKNNILFLIILSILLLISNMHIRAQRYMVDGISRVSIPYDSVFSVFVPPEVPEFLFGTAGDFEDFVLFRFSVLCIVDVDTNGKVRRLRKYPLYDLGNSISDTSQIWKSVLASIDSVSKLWEFKPILHEIKDSYSPELKAYLMKSNLGKAKQRPFHGTQSHVFLLDLTMPYRSVAEPQFFYYLSIIMNSKNKEDENSEEENK